jgi:two-component system, chemotaxis family, chemotaxis protein CheY
VIAPADAVSDRLRRVSVMSEPPFVSEILAVVVCDSANMRKLLRETLLNLGLRRIYLGDSGAETIKVIVSIQPEVIILDWELERRTVDAFLSILRLETTGMQRRLPIIALQSNPTRLSAASAATAGARCVLAKPLVPRDLWNRVLWLARQRNPAEFDLDATMPAPVRRADAAVQRPGLI